LHGGGARNVPGFSFCSARESERPQPYIELSNSTQYPAFYGVRNLAQLGNAERRRTHEERTSTDTDDNEE
jgi:hypothetical protein